jgi:hypothetical protein
MEQDLTPPHGIPRPDQLDVKCEVERRAIAKSFDAARERVASWEPGREPGR